MIYIINLDLSLKFSFPHFLSLCHYHHLNTIINSLLNIPINKISYHHQNHHHSLGRESFAFQAHFEALQIYTQCLANFHTFLSPYLIVCKLVYPMNYEKVALLEWEKNGQPHFRASNFQIERLTLISLWCSTIDSSLITLTWILLKVIAN